MDVPGQPGHTVAVAGVRAGLLAAAQHRRRGRRHAGVRHGRADQGNRPGGAAGVRLGDAAEPGPAQPGPPAGHLGLRGLPADGAVSPAWPCSRANCCRDRDTTVWSARRCGSWPTGPPAVRSWTRTAPPPTNCTAGCNTTGGCCCSAWPRSRSRCWSVGCGPWRWSWSSSGWSWSAVDTYRSCTSSTCCRGARCWSPAPSAPSPEPRPWCRPGGCGTSIERRRATTHGVRVGVAVLLALGLVGVTTASWAPRLRPMMTVTQEQPLRSATTWLADNVPRNNVVVVHDSIWTDLVHRYGFNPRPIMIYKLDSDPAVRDNLDAHRLPGRARLVLPHRRRAAEVPHPDGGSQARRRGGVLRHRSRPGPDLPSQRSLEAAK